VNIFSASLTDTKNKNPLNLLKILAMEAVKHVSKVYKPESKESVYVSLYDQSVPAGFPSPAMDYIEKRIDLNEEYIRHPLATFIVACEGNSMINAFIPPNARLIVDRSLTPQNGDIVLAVLNGEFTVKFLKKNNYRCWLCPANSKYADIEITEEMNLQIWGVVTTIITDTKDVKRCML
jgi:DNA polymerase V